MKTLPTPDNEKVKVTYRKGVRVHYEYYWSEKFKDPEVVGAEVEVRYDPFDISHVFAFVKGEWTRCVAAHYMVLRHHSIRELQLISAELRKRQSLAAQHYPLTIRHIAEFLASVEAEEACGLQRFCDAESGDILQAIDVSYTAQFPLFQASSSPLSLPDEGEGDDDRSEVDEAEIYGDYE